MKKRLVLGIIATLFALFALFAYRNRGLFMFLDIPAHLGQGEFQNTSRPYRPLVLNGYRIVFQPMDLSKDYELNLTFSRLPEIGAACHLYLMIDDPQERFAWGGKEKLLVGRASLELKDSHGNMVAHLKGNLSDLIWSGPQAQHKLYSPEYPTPSVFAPRSNESYKLRIWYKGDPELVRFKGFAAIECGGGK